MAKKLKKLRKKLKRQGEAIAELNAILGEDYPALEQEVAKNAYAVGRLHQQHEVMGPTIVKIHDATKGLNSNLAHLMQWAMDNGYKPQPGTEIHRRYTATAVSDAPRLPDYPSDEGTDHAGTRAPASSDDRPVTDEPEPGACGDPECPVLHADPANPIHPPGYVDSRIRDFGDGVHGTDSREGLQPGPTMRDWGWLRFQEREAEVAERRRALGLPIHTLRDPSTPNPDDSSRSRRAQSEIPRDLAELQDELTRRPPTTGLLRAGDIDYDRGIIPGLPDLITEQLGLGVLEGRDEASSRTPFSHGFEDPRHNQRRWR